MAVSISIRPQDYNTQLFESELISLRDQFHANANRFFGDCSPQELQEKLCFIEQKDVLGQKETIPVLNIGFQKYIEKQFPVSIIAAQAKAASHDNMRLCDVFVSVNHDDHALWPGTYLLGKKPDLFQGPVAQRIRPFIIGGTALDIPIPAKG